MEIRRKTVRKQNINHKGSTMVETLVSFVVLFIVLAALYRIVVFSSELYMRSVDTSRLQQKFYIEIYKKTPDTSFIEKTRFIKGFGGKKENDDGTYSEHAALSLSIVDENGKLKDSEIYLNNISVTSYVCTEDNDGKGIVPKAVIFTYEK